MEQVTRFGGHTINSRTEVRAKRTKNQRATGHRKGTIKTLPRNQEQPIERRQETRGKRTSVRENLSRRHIKCRLNQKDIIDTQPEGGDAQCLTHWPSKAQTLNLTLTTEKPPSKGGWMTTKQETSSRLLLQKKEKIKEDSSFRKTGWKSKTGRTGGVPSKGTAESQ